MDLKDPDIFHPPVKRSITIAGHQTSITLEPLFWDLLKAASEQRDLPLNALVAQIDVLRLEADEPPGLATAIRLWLVQDLMAGEGAG
ncbi:ribbon-helix-helix domain-containing protein [Parasphingorhabdus halotolerans]|uniref:Ribbon-helix-helix domain-containing protein n=1 Tax=Parasphingorhabdus halotolerans TaxID=2725558 RepID=A0A6H2DRY9_9SPHN|nr:ribbon-helix-helix domain-containing protein [Parasphingorhabdus halotolerans]QJB70426.1 ribbon-helix-helix domain-containing protein [Parasphingorhabdus halotolerans]